MIDAIVLAAFVDPYDEGSEVEPTLEQLVVHYQPIARLDNGQIIGFEALVRWQHPTQGFLYPASFLPQAIDSGFIEVLDQWVRDQSFRQLVEWQSRFPCSPPLWMSVNLPDHVVTSPTFMGSLTQSIAETGVAAKDVMVEINENVLLDDPDSTFAFLSQLNGIGVRLALENFGSSFSPIAYIHRIPIDCLKIDRSFTSDLPDAMGTIWLMECIAKFAGSMGMMCVVEGVERDDQVGAIRSMGLSMAQGSLISAPTSAKQCEALLAKSSVATSSRENAATLPMQAGSGRR